MELERRLAGRIAMMSCCTCMSALAAAERFEFVALGDT